MGALNKLGKLSLVVGLAMGLSACKTFRGEVVNTESLQLKAKKGTATVAPGSHDIKISFPSKKKITMEISDAGSNKSVEVEFKVPKSAILPEHGGALELLAKDSGQPYDIVGSNDVQFSNSQVYRDRESCSIETKDRQCEVVVVNGVEERKCHDVVHTISGDKDVEYYDSQESDRLELDLLAPADGRVVAHARASYSNSEKIYTFQGPCMTGGGWHPGGPLIDIGIHH